MNRGFRLLLLGLCLIFVGQFFWGSRLPVATISVLGPFSYIHLGNVLVLVALAFWAAIAYVRAETLVLRVILMSIVVDVVLVCVMSSLIWANASLSGMFRPAITMFSYLGAILMICAFAIGSISQRRRGANHEQ